ncbi:MAG: class I SAM-dependent methyltransferase [Gammaproteobacteria bacterium]
MLWPLWNRAAEARRADPLIHDPMSIELIERIDYDFEATFGPPDVGHAIRARFGDDLISAFLHQHANGVVIALGEGLETQFWRVDDGNVRWYSVDLDEAIDVRQRLLPDHPRNVPIARSALDTSWFDEVATGDPVFISAAGLLMYFERTQVIELLRALAGHFRAAELFFDIIPPWFSRATLRGFKLTRYYTVPAMPFGLGLGEVRRFAKAIPGLELVSASSYAEPFPSRAGLYAVAWLFPWVRSNLVPGLVHARVSPM